MGGAHETVANFVGGIATQADMPTLTMEMINESNAASAEENKTISKAEALAILRTGGETALASLRQLSDEQLANATDVMGQSMTAEQAAQGILISHVQEHMASFKATTGT